MSCHIRFIYTSLCLFYLVSIAQFADIKERRCFSVELGQCWVGETCQIQKLDHAPQGGEADGICTCLRSHVRDSNGYCMPVNRHPDLPSPSRINADAKSSSASIAAGVLIPLFFIGLAAIVVLGRRFGWWHRLRQPRIMQYDTALVGGDLDDDPPIA